MGSRGAGSGRKAPFSNKKSKVKQTLYHGTGRDFNEFSSKNIGENTGNNGLFGEGFYFTQDRQLAESYSNGGNVYSVKVNIENPFNWNSIKNEAQFNEFKQDIGIYGITWNKTEGQIHVITDTATEKAFTKALKKKGYDGVIYKYKSGAKEIVAFKADQIKIIEKEKVKTA